MRANNSILSFIFVFLVRGSLSTRLIDHSCMKASKGDPNLSYNFCVTCLDQATSNKNITSLEELVETSIELSITNATNIMSMISQLLHTRGKRYPKHTRGALQDCFELYGDANSSLYDAMSAIRLKDYSTANIDVSSSIDSSLTCEDGFAEKKGEVSPLTKENNIFFQLTAVDLAFVNMLG